MNSRLTKSLNTCWFFSVYFELKLIISFLSSLKMRNPAIQNDFSYYRRTISRNRINNMHVSKWNLICCSHSVIYQYTFIPFVVMFFLFDTLAVMFSSSHWELISSPDDVIRVELFMRQSACWHEHILYLFHAAGKILKSFTDYFFSCFHQLDIENEVNNEMANRMSLFYAEATPMLKTLSNATTHFVSEVGNGGEKV